jgi:hypothetical protein
VKKLTQHLKQALSALAAADAGEMLTRRQMTRVLHSRDGSAVASTVTSTVTASRRKVALWAGHALSKEALDYALSACTRMDADLCVLHAQSADTGRLRKTLGNGSTQIVPLSGRPEAALRHFLATHPQVAFLVLDGDDHASHTLAQRSGSHVVPMVVVTGQRADRTSHTPHSATPMAALG